ncbi:MAG: YciI family protein [Actinomycetota bacterium]
MQYILLIYGDESEGGTTSPEEMAKSMQEWGDYTQYLKDKGYHLAGDALHPTHDATTVRVREGKTITTDGPFAETKEQLGGYYVVDCPSLDEAIDSSARMPIGMHGTVEIRPIMVFDEEGRPSM